MYISVYGSIQVPIQPQNTYLWEAIELCCPNNILNYIVRNVYCFLQGCPKYEATIQTLDAIIYYYYIRGSEDVRGWCRGIIIY